LLPASCRSVAVALICRIDLYEIKARLRRADGLREALARRLRPLQLGDLSVAAFGKAGDVGTELGRWRQAATG
jgi:hypothetical protein